MKDYRLVLCAEDPQRDRTGYVHCADDERAREAATKLLQRYPECRMALVYDGERLALTLAQEAGRQAS